MTQATSSSQKVLVFDFGAQYGQLIARRVRDLNVYSEIVPCDITADEVREMAPSAIILSGGPASVNAEDAPRVDPTDLRAWRACARFLLRPPGLRLSRMAAAFSSRWGEYGAAELHVRRCAFRGHLPPIKRCG